MRQLTGHKVNGVNDGLEITARDEPGPGNANHVYRIYFMMRTGQAVHFDFCFQNGPIAEVGISGVTHEALLEIIKDRLIGFQSGPYACQDNVEALSHVQAAMDCLKRRTIVRRDRGVEGTMTA